MTQPFVAMSRFAVTNDKLEEVKNTFRNRPRMVDQAHGFIRMAVISPEQALGEGMGLGLSFADGFARLCDGSLKLTSSAGLGTTARLALPDLVQS